ncbi:MAG: dihydroorotate dehydrogenase-like protein [Actinomycetota bacterium]
MTDLATDYLGLRLRSPLIASSSPMTATVDRLRRLDDAGVGAVVLPSLFEEQLEADARTVGRVLDLGQGHPEAAGYFPDLDDYTTGPDRYLELVEQARAALEVPVLASLNGTTSELLVRHASLVEAAGADAIELNLYSVAADPAHDSAAVEQQALDQVAAVRAATSLPLAVKIGPFFTAMAHMAQRLVDAGAGALVLFNRFYQPDIDPETLEVTPHLELSLPGEMRLPLRWVALLSGRLDVDLCLTTGVHRPADAARALLAGADVVALASALIEHGPGHVSHVEQGLSAWMVDHEYESVAQLRGSVSQASVEHPETYERANYLKVLLSRH